MNDKLFLLAVLLIVTLALAIQGCATIEGVGKDLQDGSRITRQYMAEENQGK